MDFVPVFLPVTKQPGDSWWCIFCGDKSGETFDECVKRGVRRLIEWFRDNQGQRQDAY